jgi:glycine cleavage system protein P-like pyridoxal-binding family
MPHGHGGPGENPVEIGAFADSFLKGGTPLAAFQSQGRHENNVWATFRCDVPVKKAYLLYTKKTGDWEKRTWYSKAATFTSDNGQVRVDAELPAGTAVYYLNIQDNRNCIVSTEHVELLK